MNRSRTVSDADFDVELFAEIDRYAGIKQRRNKLFRAQDVFADAETEAIREVEENGSRRLNLWVFLLTTVSLVGVAAAVIDAWDNGIKMFGDRTVLWAILLALPGLVSFIYLMMSLMTWQRR
jgi:hypothetical protein